MDQPAQNPNDLAELGIIEAPWLNKVIARQNAIRQAIESRMDMLIPELSRSVKKYFEDLKNKVGSWVMEFEPNTALSPFALFAGEGAIRSYAEEISAHVEEMIEKEQAEWQKTIMSPLIANKIETIFSKHQKDIDNIVQVLDAIQVVFDEVGLPNTKNTADADLSDANSNMLSQHISDSIAAIISHHPIFMMRNINAVLMFAVIGLTLDVAERKTRIAQPYKDSLSNTGTVLQITNGIEEKLRESTGAIFSKTENRIREIANHVNRAIEGMNEQVQETQCLQRATLDSCEKTAMNLLSKSIILAPPKIKWG